MILVGKEVIAHPEDSRIIRHRPLILPRRLGRRRNNIQLLHIAAPKDNVLVHVITAGVSSVGLPLRPSVPWEVTLSSATVWFSLLISWSVPMYLMSDLEMSEMRDPMYSDMVGDGGGC